jgi:hypothetical protein
VSLDNLIFCAKFQEFIENMTSNLIVEYLVATNTFERILAFAKRHIRVCWESSCMEDKNMYYSTGDKLVSGQRRMNRWTSVFQSVMCMKLCYRL